MTNYKQKYEDLLRDIDLAIAGQKEGETKINGTVLSTGAEVLCGKNPAADIRAWDGIVYDIEADKDYTFYISGAKWRLAGFKFE